METFNETQYKSQLSVVTDKLNNLSSVQHLIRQKDEEVLAARQARKEQVQKLLEVKKGLDLRSESKKDRETRTIYLREVGILLPNECIEKVREPRVK